MFTATRSRRERDREQRRAAANRRIGHELAWAYFWGPKVAAFTLLAALAVGARWLWTHVDHERIAGVGGGIGLVLLLAYLAWWLREHSPYGSPSRYRRYAKTSAMHFVGLAGALLVAGAVVVWSNL